MLDMLVIQFGDHTVKGYADRSLWPAEEDIGTRPTTPPIRIAGSDTVQEVPLDGAKAIFFVKSFEGKSHDDLRFHDHLMPMDCLWVRVHFHDGEVIEGIIRNTCHFIFHAGFFMSPIDPEGNNWLIYVFKNQLKDFHILGLRPAPKNLPNLQQTDHAQSIIDQMAGAGARAGNDGTR
jgi:hypothetical protein